MSGLRFSTQILARDAALIFLTHLGLPHLYPSKQHSTRSGDKTPQVAGSNKTIFSGHCSPHSSLAVAGAVRGL